MTVAVCFKCGEFKYLGALTPCAACTAFPETDDDFVTSMALSDHHFDVPTMTVIGEKIRKTGKAPSVDPAGHARLLQLLNDTGVMARTRELSKAWKTD